MPWKTNHLTSHVRDHKVEPLLMQVLMSLLCCGQQGPVLIWRAAPQPGSVSSERWLPASFWSVLVLFSKCIFQIKLWTSNPFFKQKNLESGEKTAAISCGYGVPKRTFCAQFVGVGVCMSREMLKWQLAHIVQFGNFINVAFPHVQPSSASPSPSCTRESGWGEKKRDGFVCIYALFSLL